MPLEMTEIRKNIFKYMARIGDLVTSKEDVERYMGFTKAVRSLADQTDALYTPDAQGNYPALTDENLTGLKNAYKEMLGTGYRIAGSGEGPVAQQLSGIVTELSVLAQKDMAALEVVDTRRGLSLPEVIGNGRSVAVDIGSQEISASSGQMSMRIPINVEQPDGTMRMGFFTQTTNVDTRGEIRKLGETLGKKYPGYEAVFNTLNSMDDPTLDKMQFLNFKEAIAYTKDGMSNEQYQAYANDIFKDILKDMKMPQEMREELSGREDFSGFMDELGTGMGAILQTRNCYTDKRKWLGLEEGANIDKRNAAMSTVSGLLGKPSLVAHAEPMIVMVNGKPVSGTFMDNASGVEAYHIKEKDAQVRDYGPEHYDNPAVFDDIAAIQAIDYICGNVDRHEGNFFMNFDQQTKKLVGITAIDNDLSFGKMVPGREVSSGVGNKWVGPAQMGVIGEAAATAIMALNEEMLSVALAGYGLSKDEISAAWQRTKTMQDEIQRGNDHYFGKNPGELDKGFLRVVPDNQWANYDLGKIASMGANQFDTFSKMSSLIKSHEAEKGREAKLQEKANTILGVQQKAPDAKAPAKEPAVAKPVDTGMVQGIDQMGIKSPETIRVVVAEGETIGKVGGAMSSRNPVEFERDGKTVQGFFTAAVTLDRQDDVNRVIDNVQAAQPEYMEEMEAIRRHLLRSGHTNLNEAYGQLNAKNLPYEDLGFSAQRAGELREDRKFAEILSGMQGQLRSASVNIFQYCNSLGAGKGTTIERRNVAMSKMGDLLGTPDLLARSTTMQMQVGDRIVDGVFMEAAPGVDRDQVRAEDAAAKYGEEVYNSGPGLKSLAELQLLDYICLNADRHGGNMFYQFSKGPNPKFMGVVGIDNDLSFGSRTPAPGKRLNEDTPLDQINMVSERMAESIKKTTPEDLERTLSDQGISHREIRAAQERLAMVQARIESGKIRTVPDKEWDQMKLSDLAVKGNIFYKVQKSMLTEMQKNAEGRSRMDAEKGGRPGPLRFAKTSQVKEFGAQALEKRAEKEAIRKAGASFEKEMRDLAKGYQIVTAKTDAEIFKDVQKGAKDLYKVIDDADPALMRSSKQYREMKQEADKLRDLTQRVGKRIEGGGKPTAEETAQMLKGLAQLGVKAAEYADYKLDSVSGDEKQLNKTERRRVAAARTVGSVVNGLMDGYRRNEPVRQQELNAQRHINQWIGTIQNEIDMPGRSPEQVQTLAATMIYMKAMNISDQKLGKQVTAALSPEARNKAVQQIKEDPGFKEFAKQGTDKLIELATAGKGDKLYQGFLKERAAQMSKEKERKLQSEAPKKENTVKVKKTDPMSRK